MGEDTKEYRRIIEILNERTTPQLTTILTKMETIMAALDTLRDAVARTKSVQDSAVILMNGLKTRLDNAIANGPDSGELEALSADIGVSTDALAAAVAKNTVADSAAKNPEPPSFVEVPEIPTEPAV